ILRRLLAEALAVLDAGEIAGRIVPRLQRENIGRRTDQPVLIKTLDQLRTEPFDVEAVAGDEMLQPLDRLGTADKPAGTAPDHLLTSGCLIHLFRRVTAADGAMIREYKGHT